VFANGPTSVEGPTGRWVNDGGTVIELVCHEDGRLSGTIRFGSDGTAYKPHQLRGTCVKRPGGRRGIVGTVAGWPQPSSVTVWCGELGSDGTTLTTSLFMAAGPGPTLDWETATGGTEFRRFAGRRTA
jgi:hypothetical protein